MAEIEELLPDADPNVITITTDVEDAVLQKKGDDLEDPPSVMVVSNENSIAGGETSLLKQPNKYMFVMEAFKSQMEMPSMENLKPWSAMIADMERPTSLAESLNRVSHNQAYYRTNYLFLACAFAACTIFTTPSLFWMAIIAGGFAVYTYYWREPYELAIPFTSQKMTSDTLVKVVAGACLLITIYTGSIVTLLWTLFITLMAAAIHSIFRKVPEENLFAETEPDNN